MQPSKTSRTKKGRPSGGPPFPASLTSSVFRLVSLVVIAQCICLEQSVEHPRDEIRALLPDCRRTVPTLLKPCAEVEHILAASFPPACLGIRRSRHSIELHHNLH